MDSSSFNQRLCPAVRLRFRHILMGFNPFLLNFSSHLRCNHRRNFHSPNLPLTLRRRLQMALAKSLKWFCTVHFTLWPCYFAQTAIHRIYNSKHVSTDSSDLFNGFSDLHNGTYWGYNCILGLFELQSVHVHEAGKDD